MILSGKNLNERHKEINTKVIETIEKKINFEEIKNQIEESEVDKIFKIKVASKYEDIDYIEGVLKSGDSLYISKALKCDWLYETKYSSVINVQHLKENIFPLIPLKQRNKILSAIALHIKNEKDLRIEEFYKYCMDVDLPHYADKFLNNAKEAFKLDAIKNNALDRYNEDNIKYFIRNSFILAEAYIGERFTYRTIEKLINLRYLFAVSNLQYLDILEKHLTALDNKNRLRFGLRLSKDIITKHKSKVLKSPQLYVNLLNQQMLVKHSSATDAQIYIRSLLPDNAKEFWNINFCDSYEFIINLIPTIERFEFIKTTFLTKYPGETFEMSCQFHELEYHRYMTVEEKELWAKKHLESDVDIIYEPRQKYLWYKYITFDDAFPKIKQFISVSSDPGERYNIIAVLIKSARNHRELEKLFSYVYERHVNEKWSFKDDFIHEVISTHQIWDFDDNCWNALNRLFWSMDVYNFDKTQDYRYYRYTAIIYYAINKKELPKNLEIFVKSDIPSNIYTLQSVMEHLDENRKKFVRDYFVQLHVDYIKSFEDKDYSEEIKKVLRPALQFVRDFVKNKTKSEYPEIIIKFMKLDSSWFFVKGSSEKITSDQLKRYLKKDAAMVVTQLPKVKETAENSFNFVVNTFLKKLKIYFSDNIAKKYLNFFTDLLKNREDVYARRIIRFSIFIVFQLADESTKCDLMKKYAPIKSKIDHQNIDRHSLYIQEAICNFACYSRPKVPLDVMMMYLKGDYVKYCLPMFNIYYAHLPFPILVQFVERLLISPVSIQKHGLRLSLKCFDGEKLKNIICETWNRNRNVTIRTLIYTSLFHYVNTPREPIRMELYDILKTLTHTINEDDQDEVMVLLTDDNRMPRDIKGDYLQTAWETITKFKNNTTNTQRKAQIIRTMTRCIDLISKEALHKIVQEHINDMLYEKKALRNLRLDDLYDKLDCRKWELVKSYVVFFCGCDENVERTVESITMKCFEMWNNHYFSQKDGHEVFFFKKIYFDFVQDVLAEHFGTMRVNFGKMNIQLNSVLNDLQNNLSKPERYLLEWEIKMAMATTNVIVKIRSELENNGDVDVVIRNATSDFGTDIGKMIIDSTAKKFFYATFILDIIEILRKCFERLSSNWNIQDRSSELETDHINILIAHALTTFVSFETYYIAVVILSNLSTSSVTKNPYYLEQYNRVINAIHTFGNDEILCKLHQSIVNNGFLKI